MSRASLVVVLAEDSRHVSFVRRFLYRFGYSRHDIRFEDLPSGRSCGEQWVRERYAKAVMAFRSRSARAQSALIVAIDADTSSVDQRAQQLRDALAEANVPHRVRDERIAHVIPKRSIETWILCLTGVRVDEQTDYRQEPGIDLRIERAAVVFFDWSRANATYPPGCVPSLAAAIPEVRRLE